MVIEKRKKNTEERIVHSESFQPFEHRLPGQKGFGRFVAVCVRAASLPIHLSFDNLWVTVRASRTLGDRSEKCVDQCVCMCVDGLIRRVGISENQSNC